MNPLSDAVLGLSGIGEPTNELCESPHVARPASQYFLQRRHYGLYSSVCAIIKQF
jgi:hypothetical protein